MKKTLIALLLVLLLCAGALAENGSTLRNPSMETLNEDGTTTYWDVWPGNPNEGKKYAFVDTEVFHTGAQSLRVDLTPENNQAVYQYKLLETNTADKDSGAEEYFNFNRACTVTVWVKLDNVTADDGDGIRLGVHRKGIDGNWYNLQTESIELGTKDWHMIELEVPKSLVSIAQFDVIIDIGRGSGSVWMDDFDLIPAPAATATPAVEPTTEPTVEPTAEPTLAPTATPAPAAPAAEDNTTTVIIVCVAIALVAVVAAGLIIRKNKKK